MQGLLYEQDSLGVFLLLTVALGGGAAWLTGRAIAATWRPWWHVILLTFLLGGAVRFLHFALFEGMLLSLQFYLADTAVCMIFGLAGFRVMRVRQMVTNYRWINEPAGPFSWRQRAANRSEFG